MKKLSVIVPIYNSELYLDRCIKSIQRQTYLNLEIILINDGSTDKSLDICNKYKEKDDRIVVIDRVNGGVSSARNYGIDIAQGEYIAFVDSDDYILDNMYEKLINNLEKYNCDISSCLGEEHYNKKRYCNYNSDNQKIIFNTREKILKDFFTNCVLAIGTCNKVYKKKVIANKRFNINIKNNEDKLFLFDIYENCNKCVHQNFVGYIYCIHNGSASTIDNCEKYLDVLYVSKQIENSVEKKYKDFFDISQVSTLSTKIFVYKNLLINKNNEFKKIKKELKKDILNYDKKFKKKLKTIKKLELILILYCPIVYILLSKVYYYIKYEKHL